jgi:hypothetical protein
VLTYPQVNFPALPHHPYAEHPDPFWAFIVLDGSNVGLWKRTVRPDVVQVEVRLAPTVSSDGRDQVRVAAQRLSDFLERDLSLIENEGTPHLWGGSCSGVGQLRPLRQAPAATEAGRSDRRDDGR